MAYTDTANASRTLGTGAAVLALEAGLALALITGLAQTITPRSYTQVNTTNIPLPKPKDPPPPEARTPARKDPSAIDRPEVLLKLPPVAGQTSTELTEERGSEGTSVLGDVKFPEAEPTLDPPPMFRPKGAMPRGKTGLWVTTNDYPTYDLRLGHQGTTRYRLTIDTAGRVTNCAITTSSGWPGLDKAACDRVSARAKFEPATDQTGARIAGAFAGSVTWQIPQE
jgi:protein TonB